MRAPATVLVEARALLRLAGPLVANNLALAGMNLTDAVMAGRIDRLALAAVGVGNGVWMVVFLFGLGILMAMSPITAQTIGGGRASRVGRYVRQCLWLSQLLAAIAALLLANAGVLLHQIGVDPQIVPITGGYVGAIAWGLPGIYAYLVLRFVSEGMGHTRPIMFVAGMALVINALANYVLMYGKFGFPALGAVGCGYASALTQWLMLAAMLTYVRTRPQHYRSLMLFARFDLPDFARLRELLAVGLPIGLSILAEIGLFASVALLMGTLGAVQAAAHQIALNVAATAFMVPLAVHSAIIIRVGHAVGRDDQAGARFCGLTGIALCAMIMAVSALLLLSFRDAVAAFYTRDAAVRDLAAQLLVVAALFQISDGTQAGAMGALRGLKDTRAAMWISLVAYWLVGFPLAYGAGVLIGAGPVWIWAALVVALSLAAVALCLRFLTSTAAAARRGLPAHGPPPPP